MPEGNTLHRLAREHNRDLAGRRVRASSPQGRFAREARRLDRRLFQRADAYGKHLFHFWEGGLIVHVHLGMAGDFTRFEGPRPRPRPSVRLRLSVPDITIDLIGPPTCELISENDRQAILARLGPDPLRRDADPDRAWRKLKERKRAIGDILLDQRVISGVGNIFRNEALYLTGIHPLRSARRLTRPEWDALWDTITALMRRALARGRIVTVDRRQKPHPRAADEPRDAFYVYQREVCRRCGSGIREFPLSGRRMFACESCQTRRPLKLRPGKAVARGIA